MARSFAVENLLPQNVVSIINYLHQFTEVAQWGTPSCSRPQPATDTGVREGRSNWLGAPPTLHRVVPLELHVLHSAMRAVQITRSTSCTEWAANVRPSDCQANALPVRTLRVYRIYNDIINYCFYTKCQHGCVGVNAIVIVSRDVQSLVVIGIHSAFSRITSEGYYINI